MKKILFIALLFVQCLFSQSNQKNSLIDKMGAKVCECTLQIDFKKDYTAIRLAFDKCVETSIKNNEKQIIEVYGANYLEYKTQISKTIEKYLEGYCLKLQEKIDNERKTNIENTTTDSVEVAMDTTASYVGIATEGRTGKFKGTFEKHFKFLTLKNEEGKIESFVFLNETFDDDLILKNKIKLNQEIEIRYFEKRLYNAFLKKFEIYKVIEEIITNLDERK